MSLRPGRANLLDTRRGRFLAFGTLYISEGIPFGFSAEAMVMFMRREGLSLDQIGAFAAAQILPWGFKWAWAPLVDIVKLNRFGGRRAWIMLCLSMMIVTLVTMAMVDFETHYRVLIWMVVLNNIFCATQDVAIDSLAVGTLKEDERGTANGFMFGGQYLGIALGGGGAIYASVLWGFNASLIYVSTLLAASLLFVVFFIRDPDAGPSAAVGFVRKLTHMVTTAKTFFGNLRIAFLQSGRGPKLGLLIAILPVGAMALSYATLGTIQVDYGLPEESIAQLSLLSTIIGGIGCVVGGWSGDKLGIRKTMAFFYVLTTVPTLYLATKISMFGLQGVAVVDFYGAISVHAFSFGAAYALHTAVFMGMTSPAVAATQFTAYMAISNLAVSTGNFWQGMVAEQSGYATVFYLDASIVVLALMVIPFLRNREEKVAPVSFDEALAPEPAGG